MLQIRAHFLVAVTAALLATGGAASASAIVGSAPSAFDPGLAAGQSLAVDFNNSAPTVGSGSSSEHGYAFSWTGGSDGKTGIYSAAAGLVPSVAAPPAGLTTGNFFAVTAHGELDLSLSKAATSMSVYVGSLDSYNKITFEGPKGFSETFTGNQLAALAGGKPDGSQSSGLTNRRFFFNFEGQAVNKVVFGSDGSSFEFADIAFGYPGASGVPEPSTWALLVIGVGMIGVSVRRRRSGAALAL
jgi:hypothetical protein